MAARNPACNETIRELSRKWAERTKKLATKWPEGGTFDVAMCKEIEVLIKNYKTNYTFKKRNEKREQELGVLTLFKLNGIKLIKLEKQERENKNNETKRILNFASNPVRLDQVIISDVLQNGNKWLRKTV